jgi:acylphosphatase
VVRQRLLITGRVQGVFFRDTCRRVALELGVSGWVRNLPDGRVEAVAEGPADAVDGLVGWARHGPPDAIVSGVELREEPPQGLHGFRVR